MICPLHGPILKENLAYYINKYDIWSSYKPENEGIFIACASIHGNTKKVSDKIASILESKGAKKVVVTDLARDDMSEAVEDAFRYNKLILAASSYNAGIFTPMEDFLNKLKHRNYQNRTIAIIENGSWAPSAAKTIKDTLHEFKNINIVEPIITITSTLKEENISELEKLAINLL